MLFIRPQCYRDDFRIMMLGCFFMQVGIALHFIGSLMQQ